MLRTTLLAGAALLLAATPALAHQCPRNAGAIEAALANSNLSDADKTQITALKEQGMGLHNAGSHEEAEHVLGDAMAMLLKGFGM